MKTQAGGSGGRDEGAYPSDLSHYLISLGELLVTWLSPQGVGAALSRRLLASGSSWSLLRTIGRAFRPELVRTCMAWHGMVLFPGDDSPGCCDRLQRRSTYLA